MPVHSARPFRGHPLPPGQNDTNCWLGPNKTAVATDGVNIHLHRHCFHEMVSHGGISKGNMWALTTSTFLAWSCMKLQDTPLAPPIPARLPSPLHCLFSWFLCLVSSGPALLQGRLIWYISSWSGHRALEIPCRQLKRNCRRKK